MSSFQPPPQPPMQPGDGRYFGQSQPPAQYAYTPQQQLNEAPGATAGLVLGICSIVMSWPLVGLILGFIGLMKSKEAKAICDAHPGYYSNSGIAQAGYICSIIGLCLSGLSSFCVCGYFALVFLAIIGAGASGP
jgi:hypothetical protein